MPCEGTSVALFLQDLIAAAGPKFGVTHEKAEASKKIEQVHADDRRAGASLARAAAGSYNKPANQSYGRSSAGKPQRYTYLKTPLPLTLPASLRLPPGCNLDCDKTCHKQHVSGVICS